MRNFNEAKKRTLSEKFKDEKYVKISELDEATPFKVLDFEDVTFKNKQSNNDEKGMCILIETDEGINYFLIGESSNAVFQDVNFLRDNFDEFKDNTFIIDRVDSTTSNYKYKKLVSLD